MPPCSLASPRTDVNIPPTPTTSDHRHVHATNFGHRPMRPVLKSLFASAVLCAGITTPAWANLAVSFDEGAPKDRFTFANTGSCAITNAQILLDLSSSKSGLIFDVTGKGAGVEVFQPMEMTAGAQALLSVPEVKDGDNQIRLDIGELKAGQSIAFTIDVDDTAGTREITVSGSEIAGAKVRYSQEGTSKTAVFARNARATVQLMDCRVS